jgi:hypothetical protein
MGLRPTKLDHELPRVRIAQKVSLGMTYKERDG